jgi:hypothetical protein
MEGTVLFKPNLESYITILSHCSVFLYISLHLVHAPLKGLIQGHEYPEVWIFGNHRNLGK